MKFIKIQQQKTNDFVKTEDRIIELLKKDVNSNKYVIKVPLTCIF